MGPVTNTVVGIFADTEIVPVLPVTSIAFGWLVSAITRDVSLVGPLVMVGVSFALLLISQPLHQLVSANLGAQVTIFRLGSDPGLARFIDQVARRVEGRVVVPDLDGLGAAVVGDYLRSRRRR